VVIRNPITIDELQADNTRLVLENRALRAEVAALRSPFGEHLGVDGQPTETRRADVMAFFRIARQEIAAKPHVPSDAVVRFRLGLIAEEFFELIDASLETFDGERGWFRECVDSLKTFLGVAPVRVDLPSFADATIDLDYVVEGARVAFGIDGAPLWDAVHQANMSKEGGPFDGAKLMKPAGWVAPDIHGALVAQGWEP
jgi:predicted HAD superfamily Cof-like phosphohydrolase